MTQWTQLALIPPTELRVRLDAHVSGPHNTITYCVVVSDPETNDESFVWVTDAFDMAVLPARVLETLRTALTAAKMAISPF